MNDPNWQARAFDDLVQRFRDLGISADLPKPSEAPDAYVARLFGWVLDAVKRAPTHPVTDASVRVDPLFAALPNDLRYTPGSGHVQEACGRSFALRGVVHPAGLPPVTPIKHEGGQ